MRFMRSHQFDSSIAQKRWPKRRPERETQHSAICRVREEAEPEMNHAREAEETHSPFAGLLSAIKLRGLPRMPRCAPKNRSVRPYRSSLT